MVTVVQVPCQHCGNVFDAPAREVKRGNGRFCSRACFGKYTSTHRTPPEPNTTCAWCSTRFYRNTSKSKNSKSGFQFCSRTCKEAAQSIGGIKDIQPDHYNNGNTNYRDRALREYPHMCNHCGYDDHPEILVVHHKDHDRSHNDLDNLEILCPNCHALVHYGGQV